MTFGAEQEKTLARHYQDSDKFIIDGREIVEPSELTVVLDHSSIGDYEALHELASALGFSTITETTRETKLIFRTLAIGRRFELDNDGIIVPSNIRELTTFESLIVSGFDSVKELLESLID